MEALVIANRGASRQAPENTIPAIKKALEAGCNMISLEVQRTQDNQPVVLADVNLDRTTNGTGKVNRNTAAELQKLDAGSWFSPEFTDTRVPTLAEALKAIGSKARVMLVLPETRSGTPWATELLKVLGTRKKAAGDVLVFSDSDSIRAVRESAPDFQYALALGEKVDGWIYLEKAEKLKLKTIRPYRSQIDSVLVRQAHAKDIAVFAHFADEEADLLALLELHVDGIVTGRPDRLTPLIKKDEARV